MDNLNIHTFFTYPPPHTSSTKPLYFNSVSSIAFRNIKLITFQTLQNQTHLKYLAELSLEFQYNSDGLVTPCFVFVVFDDAVACYFKRSLPLFGPEISPRLKNWDSCLLLHLIFITAHVLSALCSQPFPSIYAANTALFSFPGGAGFGACGAPFAARPSPHLLKADIYILTFLQAADASSNFPGHRFSFRVPARDPSGWICPQTQGDRLVWGSWPQKQAKGCRDTACV